MDTNAEQDHEMAGQFEMVSDERQPICIAVQRYGESGKTWRSGTGLGCI